MSSFVKKLKNKKIVLRILAIFALILGISVLSNILQIKSDHGINQNRGLYFQSEDSIDPRDVPAAPFHPQRYGRFRIQWSIPHPGGHGCDNSSDGPDAASL